MPDLEVHLVRAEPARDEGIDPRAPGGEVTIALCVSRDHDPRCVLTPASAC